MLRELTPSDRQDILEYGYRFERENLFLIGSFNRADSFEQNRYFGWFEHGKLHGVCAWFGVFRNLVAHAEEHSVLHALVDRAAAEKFPIETVAAFRRYGEPTVERLRFHGIEPNHQSDETVYVLGQVSFRDFSHGDEEHAQRSDADDCVLLERLLMADWRGGTADLAKPVSNNDRARIQAGDTFVLRMDGQVISKATVQGTSERYFQFGGVVTHPQHQRRGYAKRVVSALCKHYFAKGIPHAILFMRTTNEPAKKVYAAIGFRPVDEFVIAEYPVKSMP